MLTQHLIVMLQELFDLILAEVHQLIKIFKHDMTSPFANHLATKMNSH